jgi:hypothetical protein
MNTKQIRLTTTASTRENTNTTTRKKHNTQNTNNKIRLTTRKVKHASLTYRRKICLVVLKIGKWKTGKAKDLQSILT